MKDKQTYVKFDAREVKAALNLAELMARVGGVVFEQRGEVYNACCPFHNERSPSFKVERGKDGWGYHCFGCGAHGDVFSWWQDFKGCDFKAALKELAGVAGIAGAYVEAKPQGKGKRAKAVPVVPKIVEERVAMKKQPPLRPLSMESCAVIAEQRKLSVEGVWAAAQSGILWGQYMGVSIGVYEGNSWIPGGLVWGDRLERHGEMGKVVWHGRCWLISDKSGYVSQVRRMDGSMWERRNEKPFKAWTIGTSRWPAGVALIGDRRKVVLCEGGPDVLAAHDLLLRVHGPNYGQDYAVVGMFGSGARMLEEALRHFLGKRVRIFCDQDEAKELKSGKVSKAGIDGANGWMERLTNAGASVDAVEWDLTGIKDGEPTRVKDLNDMASLMGDWLDGEDCRGLWTF